MDLSLLGLATKALRDAINQDLINKGIQEEDIRNRFLSLYTQGNNNNTQETDKPYVPEHIQAYNNEGNSMYSFEQEDNLDGSIVYKDDNDRWRSNNPFANAIINIESSGNANAHNASGASGIYQFVPSTAKAYGLEDPYNAEASHKAFIKLVNDNSKILRKMGIPVNDDTRWWAHNIGPKQAKEVYNFIHKGDPVSERTLKYIKANGGFTDPREYALYWHKRISKLKGV